MLTAGSINWRSRGYLPHFDAACVQQHVVFGLADAVPKDADALQQAGNLSGLDAALDRSHGECLLRDPLCATVMQNELLHHDGERYRLLAWCIMPNHVHVVLDGCPDLAGTVRRWKSWSARQINAGLGRSGPVWRREYFDRFARTEKQLSAMTSYVESNPVTAGLISTPEAWPWSSAAHRPC